MLAKGGRAGAQKLSIAAIELSLFHCVPLLTEIYRAAQTLSFFHAVARLFEMRQGRTSHFSPETTGPLAMQNFHSPLGTGDSNWDFVAFRLP